MLDNSWLMAAAAVVGGAAGVLIISRTSWWQLRLYGVRVGRVIKKHGVQKKAEALQRTADPVRARKPMVELAQAYEAVVRDLEKIRAPRAAAEVHQETLTINRKAAELYRLVSTGSFRQKEVLRRQNELQKMERSLSEKVQALYKRKARPRTA